VFAHQDFGSRGLSAIMLQRPGGMPHAVSTPRDRGIPGDEYPILDPGGRNVAYVRIVQRDPGRPAHASIRVLNLRRGITRTVLRRRIGLDDIGQIAWAPDGRHIAAYLGHGDHGHGPGIYALDVANGDLTPLIQSSGLVDAPHWSPDGHSLLAYVGSTVRLDLRTGTITPVGSPDVRNATYSPDGKLIAYQTIRDRNGTVPVGSDDEQAAKELHVMHADGSHDRRITHTKGVDDEQPAWLDDHTLLYIKDAQVALLDLRTLRTHLITALTGPITEISTTH
jgi:roadblock/LC7 domain-containing protein